MAQPGKPPNVKLICGMISSRKHLFDEALSRLVEAFGPVDILSDIMDFDFTHYYDRQMGSPLWRRFAAFANTIHGDALVEAKLATNSLERELAASAGDVPRPINLDPGYVESSKLVLASMKNFSHRIYLGRGVFGEVTLMYHKTRWEALPWTFPDYASGRYDKFLTEARESLRKNEEAGQ